MVAILELKTKFSTLSCTPLYHAVQFNKPRQHSPSHTISSTKQLPSAQEKALHVGDVLGAAEGERVGTRVGPKVGKSVGLWDGFLVGTRVGPKVG